MKIHLVTPKNPQSFWTFQSILPILAKDCTLPNLSMPTVAGLTPPEHEVTLCDENVDEVNFDVEADIVGVTGYIIHRERILGIADEFRRRGRFVIIGGPFASVFPEEARKHCDVLFIEEAEETWPTFLQDFAAGHWKTEYAPTEKPDLTDSPMPRFDLLKTDRYHSMAVQFARGCPFTCEFCDIIVIYGRKPRAKSIPRIMAEIRECLRLGAEHVFIVDDNFIGNKTLAKELLRELARWGKENGYPLIFNTEVSLNVAQDEELLELLRAANFVSLFIGIESPRVESLAETKKYQNMRADMVKSVHKVQSYGIQVQAGMIVGFDNDDHRIFEEHFRFIQQARIPVSMTGMLTAGPETPLYERLKAEGRLLFECPGDQFAMSNFEPKQMTRAELARGYLRLVEKLYSFDCYGERAVAFLTGCGSRAGGNLRLRAKDMRLLGRVLKATLWQGGRRRAAFTLKLLRAVLIRRPSMIREALYYATLHKAFADYLEEVCPVLQRAVAEVESGAAKIASRRVQVPLAGVEEFSSAVLSTGIVAARGPSAAASAPTSASPNTTASRPSPFGPRRAVRREDLRFPVS